MNIKQAEKCLQSFLNSTNRIAGDRFSWFNDRATYVDATPIPERNRGVMFFSGPSLLSHSLTSSSTNYAGGPSHLGMLSSSYG